MRVQLCKSLVEEHDVILRVLDAIERHAGQVESEGAVDTKFFADAIAFVREYADGVHHHKEEVVLFPKMIEAGIPQDGGPIGCMLSEHEQGRTHIGTMEASLAAAGDGDAAARETLAREAMGYVRLLRQHIHKENEILFPMADQVFDSGRKAEVLAAFEEAEANDASVSDRRRQWAERLPA